MIGIITGTFDENDGKRIRENKNKTYVDDTQYKIVTIDGCEYIEYDAILARVGYALVHKGNCKNH